MTQRDDIRWWLKLNTKSCEQMIQKWQKVMIQRDDTNWFHILMTKTQNNFKNWLKKVITQRDVATRK